MKTTLFPPFSATKAKKAAEISCRIEGYKKSTHTSVKKRAQAIVKKAWAE